MRELIKRKKKILEWSRPKAGALVAKARTHGIKGGQRIQPIPLPAQQAGPCEPRPPPPPPRLLQVRAPWGPRTESAGGRSPVHCVPYYGATYVPSMTSGYTALSSSDRLPGLESWLCHLQLHNLGRVILHLCASVYSSIKWEHHKFLELTGLSHIAWNSTWHVLRGL